jgi:hypothetical protein|tara:strand:- start:40 stop:441 length:402 start_codon:yes stop_codon:yes gene_type:complete
MPRQVIVYNGDDGFCNVVIPSEQCVLSDEDIIAKDVPVAEYSLIAHTDLPTSTFRKAWKYNHSSSTVDVDLASAKEITTSILESRYLATEKENEEITRVANMRGQTPELLDNPAVPYSDISAKRSVNGLLSLL